MRKLAFKTRDSIQGDCPQVVPVDVETGDEIDLVRKCEIISSAHDITVMRVEVLVMKDEKKKP